MTQGTAQTDPEQLLIPPSLRALAEEEVLVVATTGGKPVESVRLHPRPTNVRLERFIPYYHLLPHIDAMVTNAGYGRVRQMPKPCGAQALNAACRHPDAYVMLKATLTSNRTVNRACSGEGSAALSAEARRDGYLS